MDEPPQTGKVRQPFAYVVASLVIAVLWVLFLAGPEGSLWTTPQAPIIGTLLVLSVLLELVIWARRR